MERFSYKNWTYTRGLDWYPVIKLSKLQCIAVRFTASSLKMLINLYLVTWLLRVTLFWKWKQKWGWPDMEIVTGILLFYGAHLGFRFLGTHKFILCCYLGCSLQEWILRKFLPILNCILLSCLPPRSLLKAYFIPIIHLTPIPLDVYGFSEHLKRKQKIQKSTDWRTCEERWEKQVHRVSLLDMWLSILHPSALKISHPNTSPLSSNLRWNRWRTIILVMFGCFLQFIAFQQPAWL